MPRSYLAPFFAITHGLSEKIATSLEKAKAARTYTFTDPKIVDYLSAQDWKSLDQELVAQMTAGNDRGVAIVYTSMIEGRLRWLIETTFEPSFSKSKRDGLFNGSLSSLATRADLACGLGLISESICSELRLIGSIRNRFAHGFRPVRFSDPEIENMCLNLRQLNADVGNLKENPREMFGQVCFFLMVAMFTIGQVRMHARAQAMGIEANDKEEVLPQD